MKNFYFGFKGNVFSKMFMMVAIFMAMSSSLYGASFTLTAETVDNDESSGNGYLDYIKIIPILDDGNSTDIDINVTQASKLKRLFSKGSYDANDDLIEEIEGIYDSIGGSKITGSITTTGESFYLKLKSGYSAKYNTGETYTLTYDASGDAYMSLGAYKFSSKGSLTATDKAKPVLMNVKIASIDGSADTIDLNFSEPVDFVDSYNKTTANSIKDSNITFRGNGENFDYNVSYISGADSNILKFKINYGINEKNFLNKTSINVGIKSNVIKDVITQANILNLVSSRTSNTVSLETTSPYIKSGAELDFNSTTITAPINELLKNASGSNIWLRVHNGTKGFTLTTSAIYTSSDSSLRVGFSDNAHDIVELSKLLGNDNSFSLSIVANSAVTDALGNPVSTSPVAVETSDYIKDDTKPTVSTTYIPPKIIQLNFSDAINRSDADLSTFLDINYTDNNTTPSITSWTKGGKDINITFGTNLSDNKEVNIRTKVDYSSASIKNYVNLGLEAFSTNTTISPAPPKPTYKEFFLDMDIRKIILPFNNINASKRFNSLSGTNFGTIEVNISNGSRNTTIPTNYYSMSTTHGDTNITMTLTNEGHRELSIFLGSAVKKDISLSMADMSSGTLLRNAYGHGPEANSSVGVSTYTKDDTVPEIESWDFNLTAKQIRINFNIPIYFPNSATINNKFVIASAAHLGAGDDDMIGYFNTIGVGNTSDMNTTFTLEDNKTTLTLDLNDSFMREILDDGNLSTSSSNAFLVVRSNSILNINQVGTVKLAETNSTNALTPSKFDATNGNVNIMFTRTDGVKLVGNVLEGSRNDKLLPGKWYHRSIPLGVTVTASNLEKAGFDTNNMWKYATDTNWTSASNSVSGDHTGYWIKTHRNAGANANRVLATYDGSTTTDTALINWIKNTNNVTTSYKLIGLTHDLSKDDVIDIKTGISGKKYFIHHYDINSSGSGQWDIRPNTLKEGEAIWIRYISN